MTNSQTHKVTTPMTSRGWGRTKPVASNTKPDGSDDPSAVRRIAG